RLSYFFKKSVIQEFKIVRKEYKKTINIPILRTILSSYFEAEQYQRYISTKSQKKSNTLFYSYWCDSAAIGIALAKQQGTIQKGISRCHGWDVYFNVHEINYLPFRKLIAQQIQLFPISRKGYDTIRDTWCANVDSAYISRLGTISTQRINNQKPASFKLVSCSNIISIKRINLIISTLHQFSGIQLEWYHFGDGILMEEIKQLSKELPESIKAFFYGRIPNKEIYQQYQKIKPTVFINVSSSEGIPVSIMEAMSMGIPVIATNVGGNSEIVNNENGILLSANHSFQEIATALTRFYEMSDEEYTYYSNNAYQTWNLHFNADKNYSEFINQLI